jgi:anthranilate phosphoribosyltransferase
VLEALGVRVPTPPEQVPVVLAAAGIVFLFAPGFHPAMRHAAPVRRTLGVPTIFNLLGPLSNPAGVQRQVIGVAEREQAPLVASALVALGTQHALVVHGSEGMDELSPLGATEVWEVRGTDVRQWTVEPSVLGMARGGLADLAGGEPADNASRIQAILQGRERGPARDALRLNAAAALYVSGRGWTLAESLDRATAALDAGKGLEALDRLRAATRGD